MGPAHSRSENQGRRVTWRRKPQRIDRRALLVLAGSGVLAPVLSRRTAGAETAQGWPSRFVRLVVPFPPGGGTDNIARVVAGKLSDIWGQQVVVENRGGGATNIGTESVVRADPDGYTMLLQSMPLAVNRFLFPSLGYDAISDLAPVSLLCEYANIMAVPMTSPAHSVADFIAYAKTNKGKVTFASSGHGTSVHLSGELFKRMAGIEMLHVPYRGAGPALNDLLPGRVDVMFNNIGAVLPLIQGGKLRGLAVTTAKRAPSIPELPPIAQAGVPGFDVSSWYAFFAPAKTAPEIIHKMHADTVTALADPPTKQRLEQLGVVVVGSTPAELAAFLKAEMEKWAPVIKEAGITVRD
jgi:tripartite-type tricarboxylate transporter receptor subunit TctC